MAEDGFYEIRFESIGGLGAHLAGQMLAEAGVLGAGLNGAHFSSYGSEKKGTPVRSYVRFCSREKEVRTTSPVTRPHLVAVFHSRLFRTENVISGLRPGGSLLVNSPDAPALWKERLGVQGAAVGTVDALGIAVEEKTRVNTAMLGAVTRALGFIPPEAVKEAIARTFRRKYPHLVEANLRTFDRGYEEVEILAPAPGEETVLPPPAEPEPLLGYLTAPLGGALLCPGNTVLHDLSASRQGFLPAFDRERCVDCGLCDAVCPDMCFVWEAVAGPRGRGQRLLGVDYQYCKGCLKCVEVCPTGALEGIRETEGYAEAHRLPRFELAVPMATASGAEEGV